VVPLSAKQHPKHNKVPGKMLAAEADTEKHNTALSGNIQETCNKGRSHPGTGDGASLSAPAVHANSHTLTYS